MKKIIVLLVCLLNVGITFYKGNVHLNFNIQQASAQEFGSGGGYYDPYYIGATFQPGSTGDNYGTSDYYGNNGTSDNYGYGGYGSVNNTGYYDNSYLGNGLPQLPPYPGTYVLIDGQWYLSTPEVIITANGPSTTNNNGDGGYVYDYPSNTWTYYPIDGGVGGSNTADPPTNETDCAGVVGGTAYLDNCENCVGGNTGKTACKCEPDVKVKGNIVYMTHTDCSVRTYCACCNSWSCTRPGRCGSCANVQNGIFDLPCMTSGFRTANRPDHDGVDLVSATGDTEGTPVYSPVSGTVLQIRTSDPTPGKGNGVYVILVDENGNTYYFLHMQENSNTQLLTAYEEGTTISAGTFIGNIGHTGACRSSIPGGTGAHLHYEIHSADGTPVNPSTLDPNVSNIQNCY